MTPAGPRAVVCGYAGMATVGLEALLETGWTVPLFITHEDAPGESIWWRPPADLARSRGIEVITPDDPGTPAGRARIAAAAPDFLFSFYYRSLLGAEILGIPPRGALNLHGSLLPRYRGRAPTNWVLVRGEPITGVTLHYMDEKADHGDIVDQVEIPIAFEDTALTLFEKTTSAARVLLLRTLPRLAAGTAPRRPQDHAQASYFGRRTPADGRIDWSWPAVRVYNLVRAVTHPYPGAFTSAGGRRLFVWSARPAAAAAPGATGMRAAPAAPGTVVARVDEGVSIACGEGTLLVRAAQFENGPEMTDPRALAAALPAGTRLG